MWLLAGDCCLVTAALSLARGSFVEPRESLGRAMGGFWDGFEKARAGARIAHEAHGRCWAAHGQFGLTFSHECCSYVYSGLRFLKNWGPRTLSLHTCAAKSSGPEGGLGQPPTYDFLWRLGLGREPFEGGLQVHLLLISKHVTCHHTSRVTCHLYLNI